MSILLSMSTYMENLTLYLLWTMRMYWKNSAVPVLIFPFFFLVDRYPKRTVEICEDLSTRRLYLAAFLFLSFYWPIFLFSSFLFSSFHSILFFSLFFFDISMKYNLIFEGGLDTGTIVVYQKVTRYCILLTHSIMPML